MWTISQAFHITRSQMVLPRSMSRLWKACSTKLKKKAKISTSVLWYIAIPHLQVTCNYPMQILQGRNARCDLPISNTARKQLGIKPEVIRNKDKHAVLPRPDLGQQVMYQDSTSKHWYPAVIDSLCPEPGSYKITTRDGIVYRKMQSHLKPYTPQKKNVQSSQCVSPPVAQSKHMWPMTTEHKKSQMNNQM